MAPTLSKLWMLNEEQFLIIMSLMFKSVGRRKRQQRRWWVRHLWQNRKEHGIYYHLVQELLFDEIKFKEYEREQFAGVLHLVEESLVKKSRFRDTICPRQRLSLGIRNDPFHFLADPEWLYCSGYSHKITEKWIPWFLRKVQDLIPDNDQRDQLFDSLRQYQSSQNLQEALVALRRILDEPQKLELFEYIRPLILLRHQMEYSYLAPAIPGVRLRTIRLHRTPGQSLGFAVRGGYEFNVGVFVSVVEPGSQAEKQGLKVGDEVVRVNGFTIAEAVHEDVLNLIKSRDEIVLKVTHIGMLPVKAQASDSVSWQYVDDIDSKTALDEVLEQKQYQRGHGIELKIFIDCTGYDSIGCGILSGPSYYPGIFVEKVRLASLAQEAGLEVGDQIVEVNDTSFLHIKHKEAVVVLKGSRQLNITVRKQAGLPLFERRNSPSKASVTTVISNQSARSPTSTTSHRLSTASQQQTDSNELDETQLIEQQLRGSSKLQHSVSSPAGDSDIHQVYTQAEVHSDSDSYTGSVQDAAGIPFEQLTPADRPPSPSLTSPPLLPQQHHGLPYPAHHFSISPDDPFTSPTIQSTSIQLPDDLGDPVLAVLQRSSYPPDSPPWVLPSIRMYTSVMVEVQSNGDIDNSHTDLITGITGTGIVEVEREGGAAVTLASSCQQEKPLSNADVGKQIPFIAPQSFNSARERREVSDSSGIGMKGTSEEGVVSVGRRANPVFTPPPPPRSPPPAIPLPVLSSQLSSSSTQTVEAEDVGNGMFVTIIQLDSSDAVLSGGPHAALLDIDRHGNGPDNGQSDEGTGNLGGIEEVNSANHTDVQSVMEVQPSHILLDASAVETKSVQELDVSGPGEDFPPPPPSFCEDVMGSLDISPTPLLPPDSNESVAFIQSTLPSLPVPPPQPPLLPSQVQSSPQKPPPPALLPKQPPPAAAPSFPKSSRPTAAVPVGVVLGGAAAVLAARREACEEERSPRLLGAVQPDVLTDALSAKDLQHTQLAAWFSAFELDGRELRSFDFPRHQKLGIEIEGGIGTPLAGRIVVAAVFHWGAAAEKGLQIGDQLMMINGQKLTDITVAQAEEILEKAYAGPKELIGVVYAQNSFLNDEECLTYF